MLVQLDIENIAVIEHASIEFDKGLNVITGETGAGKSLLINSLNMVLGHRSAKELIRQGADFARVSAVFFCNDIDNFLLENNIPTDEGNVIITRKLYRDGRNLCHINSSPVNVTTLRSVGEKLVVIHGQDDTSLLKDSSSPVHFLDAFADNGELLSQYSSVYSEFRQTEKSLRLLDADITSRQNEIDYLTYQTQEIENVALSAEEELDLLSRRTMLENSEAISNYSEKAYAALNYDRGAKELMYTVKSELEKLCEIDDSTTQYSEKATELYYEIEELSHDISSYISNTHFSTAELSEINDRLDVINTLKRKYKGEIADILSFYNTSLERLSALLAYDENKAELQKKYDNLSEELSQKAKLLAARRKDSADRLSVKLAAELENLDMPSCRVQFVSFPTSYGENGNESIEFLISTNPKEEPKNISKIASGGEISRIMLAIKSVFSDYDKIPTLLFDEIDTGVSGRAAEKIAKKMQSLSHSYQLICVSHLPVIAASGNHHLLIEKMMVDGGFKTTVKPLTFNERVEEIARIISGDNINDISLKNASQMLVSAIEKED